MDQEIIDANVKEIEEKLRKAHKRANRKAIMKDIRSIVIELACLTVSYLMTDHLWSFLLFYTCLALFVAFIKKGIKEYKEYRKRG